MGAAKDDTHVHEAFPIFQQRRGHWGTSDLKGDMGGVLIRKGEGD